MTFVGLSAREQVWKAEAEALHCFDRMRAAGWTDDAIEAYVLAQEREREANS